MYSVFYSSYIYCSFIYLGGLFFIYSYRVGKIAFIATLAAAFFARFLLGPTPQPMSLRSPNLILIVNLLCAFSGFESSSSTYSGLVT